MQHLNGDIKILFNTIPGSANEKLVRPVKQDWVVDAIGDFDGDGKSDVLWRYVKPNTPDSGITFVWFMDGHTVSEIKPRGGAPLGWTIAGTADLDGDGRADIVWVSPESRLRVLFGRADRGWQNLAAGEVPAGSTLIRIADFDGDGKADFLFRNQQGQMHLRMMNGNQTKATKNLPIIPADWQVFAVGDFNGDGIVDILFKRPSGSLTLWLMNADMPTIIDDAGVLPGNVIGIDP